MRIKVSMASMMNTPAPNRRRHCPTGVHAGLRARGPLALAGCGSLRRNAATGLCPARRRARTNSDRRHARPGADRSRHPGDRRHCDDGDAFYYISQKAERSAAFMLHEVVDQRVIAVYFDKERKVTRLANYGVKDGKIFDFPSQTTETGGERLNYLRGIFRNFKMF